MCIMITIIMNMIMIMIITNTTVIVCSCFACVLCVVYVGAIYKKKLIETPY